MIINNMQIKTILFVIQLVASSPMTDLQAALKVTGWIGNDECG